MDKREKTKAKIIDALKKQKGLLTMAAHSAGVSYWTVWDYCRRFPDVQKAKEEAQESMIDFTEAKLFKQIESGNIAAIIFFLKTRAKSRGYIERSEITGAEGMPLLNVEVTSEETKDDIAAVIKRFSEN